MAGNPKGAFIANLPFGFLYFRSLAMLAQDDPQPINADAPNPADSKVVFMGQMISRDEYDEICRNLSEFFGLLRKWKEEADSK
jgi:hypothetical protein